MKQKSIGKKISDIENSLESVRRITSAYADANVLGNAIGLNPVEKQVLADKLVKKYLNYETR